MLIVERHGAVAILRLNRPEAMNAVGQAGDGVAMRDACAALNADKRINCVILTGEGRAFSAGGDLKAMNDPDGVFAGSPVQIRDHYRHGIHDIVRALYELDMPVIAAVNGPAIGLGCDLAGTADIRIASDKAKFGVTFLKIGLAPGDGGAWLLPRTIGMERAAELLFTGEVIPAETAAEWGLVSRVVPHDSLMDEAMALAQRIAAMPAQALRLTKALLREGRTSSFAQALEMAASAQAQLHSTADFREGVQAMLDKRPPDFTGR